MHRPVPAAKYATGMNADASRRYRLYPTAVEAERLAAWAHTCRSVWDVALAQRQFLFGQRGVTLRASRQCRYLTAARAELDWIADLPAQAAQQVLAHLDRAYDNWWNPQHPAGPPKFKKRSEHLSMSFPGQALATRKLNYRWAEVRLPKLGWIRFRLSRPLSGPVRNATVSRDALGWHVAFGVASGQRSIPPNGLPGCGVDFGIACSAFVSTETRPRVLPSTLTEGEQRRLLGLERRKARQVQWARKHNQGRYSRRLRRTIREVARLKARQARRRDDFTHKLTTDLAKTHGWIGIEDLRVKDLTASAKGTALAPGRNVKAKAALNRRILDNAPAKRRRQLAYKATRFGSELRLVPPAGTSQTCSVCGARDPQSRPGCGREFACTACGHHAHADRNAAQNIEHLAARRAVNSTRSHFRVARPASHMREPLVGTPPRPRPRVSGPPAEEDVKGSTCLHNDDSPCRPTRAPAFLPSAGGLIGVESQIQDNVLLESGATQR
jgi:putative transposase